MGPPIVRPVVIAAEISPRIGPVNCGYGTRHSDLKTTRAVRARTKIPMAIRRTEASSWLRANTPMGVPIAPAIAKGVCSRNFASSRVSTITKAKAMMATMLTTTTTVWGSRKRRRVGEVVSPKPKPTAPMMKPANAKMAAVARMCIGSGMKQMNWTDWARVGFLV